MTDEIGLMMDVERGARAERLLGDELLAEAFTALEADYVAAWRTSAARDSDGRERLWQALQIVGLVKAHLNGLVSGGRLAQRQLDDIATRGEAV